MLLAGIQTNFQTDTGRKRLADPTLIVEHIAPEARIRGEHRFERSSNRLARSLAGRNCNVTLKIGGENDSRHNDLRHQSGGARL